MKKHFYLLTLALLYVFTACSDDNDEWGIDVADGQQTIQNVYADAETGISTIKFKTSTAWSSAIYSSGTSSMQEKATVTPDWVRITPDHGSEAGDYTIAINFDINYTGKKRSATIALTCNGEEVYIRVSQEGVTTDGKIPGGETPLNDVFTAITDVIFAEYCKQFDTNGDDILSISEAQSIKVVDIAKLNISSLAGIEYFTNLETLNCPSNHIISLDLSKNTSLKILNCDSNSLISLDVLKNTLLDSLSCANNTIESLDLSKNYALVKLNCKENAISSLDLTSNTKLAFVDCSINAIETLNTSSNIILKELRCNQNNLTTLDLSKNISLTTFDCSNNLIETLNISNSTNLENLYCSATNISALDLSTNTKLKIVDCELNSITSLDVSKSPTIEYLNCDNNPITKLDISANQALETLSCNADTNLTVLVWSAFDIATPENTIADITYNESKTTFSYKAK